ncbi:hypothetical protein JTB14_036120 [Gonioctena quinquepunctata]|nr:hypothetical protein JTB14_036120 [Gonioctena quinquepunctata]
MVGKGGKCVNVERMERNTIENYFGFILHNVAEYLQDPDEDFDNIDDDGAPFCLAGQQKRDAVAQQVLAEQR